MFDLAQRKAQELLNLIVIGKARHFRRLFLGDDDQPNEDAHRVLAHLRIYCRAEGTTFAADPYEHARREGRREVWLEINRYLQLDDAQVRRLITVESDYE